MERESIVVENLKCHGCANTITNALNKVEGVEDVSVEVESGTIHVSYKEKEGRSTIVKKLAGLGYPEEGTGNSIQKAKSYVSCAVGRLN